MTASSGVFRVACVQLRSGRDMAANVETAARLIREAARGGAVYVQTPEMTNLMEADREVLLRTIRPEAEDPGLAAFRRLAAELRIHLHVGSLALAAGEGRAVNRGFLIGPDGGIRARYDKIHMFDVDLAGGESYRESRTYVPGERAAVVPTPFAHIGLSICYDLRFPRLYRDLARAGAELLAIPAAFTHQTGEAHWHVLVRARAIENGTWVVAAAQGGRHENGRETYGHSLVVSPWGEVVAEAGTEPGVLLADIDLAAVAQARMRIPALNHERAYALEACSEPLEQVL